MSWQFGTIISGEFRQNSLGKEIINKLFWKITLLIGEVVIEEVLALLVEYVVDQMIVVQSSNLDHTEQLFLDESDKVGVALISYAVSGLVPTGDDAPTFQAFALTKGVGNRLTRPGGMRIAGVKELASNGNTLTQAYIDGLVIVGNTLGATVQFNDQFGNTMEFSPVVVGRTVDGKLDLSRVNPITNFGSPKLTSQVSRRA